LKYSTLNLVGLEAPVPAVIFYPTNSDGPHPVILAQHGGSSHKLGADIESVVKYYVPLGFAVLAVDGPIHGDRREGGAESASREQTRAEFFKVWHSPGNGSMVMTDSRNQALRWIETQENLSAENVFWYGVSMGTAYGVPFLSQTFGVRAAVLGMWGLCFPNSDILAQMASKIQIPVLFQVKWDDELFSRQGQLDLYERIASTQKWLNIYPGQHVPVIGKQADDARRFFLEHLPTAPSN